MGYTGVRCLYRGRFLTLSQRPYLNVGIFNEGRLEQLNYHAYQPKAAYPTKLEGRIFCPCLHSQLSLMKILERSKRKLLRVYFLYDLSIPDVILCNYHVLRNIGAQL